MTVKVIYVNSTTDTTPHNCMKAYHGHEFLLMASNNLSQDKLDDYKNSSRI